MLEMRFLRSGRRNSAFFRVVLTESSKPPKSGFIKVLGWFNPHTKEASLDKEEILSWLNNGAKPSNKLSKLLLKEGIKHKLVNFIPSAKKTAKQKDKVKPKENQKSEEERDDTVGGKSIEQSDQKKEKIPEDNQKEN